MPSTRAVPLVSRSSSTRSVITCRCLTGNRCSAAMTERMAPEQMRHHYISRQPVLTWMRQQRSKPSLELAGLASRLRLT